MTFPRLKLHARSQFGGPRSFGRVRRGMTAILLTAAVSSCAVLLALPSLAPATVAPGPVLFASTGTCPGAQGAFRDFIKNIPGTLVAGETITVQYRFEAMNWGPSDGNVTLYLPAIFAKFPLGAGGNFTMYFSPKTIPLPDSSWSNISSATYSKQVTTSTQFSKKEASLTTMLLALQSTAPYGLNVSMKWRWIVTPVSGPNVTSPWGTPITSLFPVQYVEVTPTLPTLSTQYLGSTWTAVVTGAISGQTFYVEVENASLGSPRGATSWTVPLGSAKFTVSTPLFYTRPSQVVPGLLLVHVHEEVCRGILSNTQVHGIFAPSTYFVLRSNISQCPEISFDGSTYSAGTNLTVTPSAAALPLGVPACAGHAFAGWSQGGSVIVGNLTAANTTVAVTYDGTVWAHWT